MARELTAKTDAGRDLVELADALAERIAPTAAEADREGAFPFSSFEAVKESGYLFAPIPARLGGLGVDSLHDLIVGASRLARGDAALAIGTNMHLVLVVNVTRRWRAAVEAGDERRERAFAATLEEIARERTVFASAVSEPAQDLTRPATTATRTADGWIVSGRKIFSTMSEAADVLYTAVTYTDDRGRELYGYAMVPRDTAGVTVHRDWDALGMRASGSHSVSFDDVRLPPSALRGGFPTSDAVEYFDRNVTAGLFHAAAALGIAETAHATATVSLARRPDVDPHAQMLAAQNVVDLSACRGVLSRAAALVDEDDADVTTLFAEAQTAKLFVGDAAVRVVDRALALSGGAGYLNGSPLARAYRDVRATAFMHPLGANRAYAFLGRLAAGREPSLH